MRMEFPHLNLSNSLSHAFLIRNPDMDVNVERTEAVARLRPLHDAELKRLGFAHSSLKLAEQVHGDGIGLVDAASPELSPNVDGLLTASRGVALGIYVADCAAVYLVDRHQRAIGLVHSGKRGTELGIVPKAISLMQQHFNVPATDVVVQISPCIRPPHYEIDFAADIRKQCLDAGIHPDHLSDSGLCTGSDLQRFYSYRQEKGKTGRMLALLGWPF